jgi:ABC-2 type transport system ATP-binding protein
LLICDEPTSALDPVGRKEILDILLTVREQTTVLFSTHILSDVERICTDVAFLNNGRIEIQGKLSDIKTKYRSEEYLMESENDTDTRKLIHAFPEMKQLDKNQLSFSERIYSSFDVLRVVSDEQISLLRFERVEPTLETLFMEVTGE